MNSASSRYNTKPTCVYDFSTIDDRCGSKEFSIFE
jgi:hypothetical protein